MDATMLYDVLRERPTRVLLVTGHRPLVLDPISSTQRPFSGGVDCGGLRACAACSKP
jgi:hypothetical protein